MKSTLKSLLSKGKVVVGEFSGVDIGTHASSIAYFTFLSLIPLLALCISIVSMVGVGEQEIAALVVALVPDALNGLAEGLVADALARSGIAFSISTIALLWSASRGMAALRAGLNAAFEVQESRSFPMLVVISVAATIVLGVLLAATMYLIFSGAIAHVLSGLVPDLQNHDGLRDILGPLVVTAISIPMFALCYAYLPDGKRRFSAQLPGAVVAAVGCGALAFGFRIYVDNFSNFTVVYGSIATVALLLMWIYFISNILIAGGFFNRLLASGKLESEEAEEGESGLASA